MILKRFSFFFVVLLAASGIFATVNVLRRTNRESPAPAPVAEPSRSPYLHAVAASGIIEAVGENVKIAPPKGGLVQKLFVRVGSKVKAGEPMLQLDNREATARFATLQAQLTALRASLAAEKVMAADSADQFQRVARLQKENVASEDERTRKEFALQNWQARVAKIEADIKAAQAQVDQAQVDLDILTLKAPRDGTILQVSIREGEYADPKPAEPLMVLGDVDKLQIRADVDEQNAPLVSPNQPAVAFLKGTLEKPLPLRFVRIEPYVIPKKSLTGDSTERVDTRVLQIIFELDRPAAPVYVGQQVDVFIERPGAPAVAKSDTGPAETAKP